MWTLLDRSRTWWDEKDRDEEDGDNGDGRGGGAGLVGGGSWATNDGDCNGDGDEGAGGKSFSNKDALEADEGKVNCLEQDRRGKRICNAPTLPSCWGDDESGDAKNLNGDDDGD